MTKRRKTALAGAIRIPTGTYILFSAWIGIAVGTLAGLAILRRIREP